VPAVRVIPCLDVAAGRVVKGVNFEGLRDIGDPVELASRYYQEGADEVTFLDVHASSENRKTMLDVVTKCAEQVFIPLTVGGGISSLADVTSLLAAGADKVSVGSAGIANPALLEEIVREHGSQVLVISLDLKRASRPSGFGVTSHGGKNLVNLNQVQECCKNCICSMYKGMKINKYNPTVLLILDGWGIAPKTKGNAIAQADTPFLDSLIKTCPA